MNHVQNLPNKISPKCGQIVSKMYYKTAFKCF